MTITVNPRQKFKPKYYIYFNDWTGEIISIGASLRLDTPAPYIVTDDDAASRIMNGLDSEHKYIVSSDRYTEERLVTKSDVLQLRKQEDVLFLLPAQLLDEWDIRVRLYTENTQIVIEVNKRMINRLVAHSMKREIYLNQRADFEFYVIKKDNPDFLIEIIQVDARTLINHGRVALDAKNIMPFANISEISVMTRRYFENYYFEILNDEYIDTLAQELKNDTTQNWQRALTSGNAHIQFNQDDNLRVTISSLVTSEQLDEVGLTTRFMNFYVIGESPDHYIDQFIVDISKIRMGEKEYYATDFDISQVDIVYHNPKLRVRKRKQHEPHPN